MKELTLFSTSKTINTRKFSSWLFHLITHKNKRLWCSELLNLSCAKKSLKFLTSSYSNHFVANWWGQTGSNQRIPEFRCYVLTLLGKNSSICFLSQPSIPRRLFLTHLKYCHFITTWTTKTFRQESPKKILIVAKPKSTMMITRLCSTSLWPSGKQNQTCTCTTRKWLKRPEEQLKKVGLKIQIRMKSLIPRWMKTTNKKNQLHIQLQTWKHSSWSNTTNSNWVTSMKMRFTLTIAKMKKRKKSFVAGWL